MLYARFADLRKSAIICVNLWLINLFRTWLPLRLCGRYLFFQIARSVSLCWRSIDGSKIDSSAKIVKCQGLAPYGLGWISSITLNCSTTDGGSMSRWVTAPQRHMTRSNVWLNQLSVKPGRFNLTPYSRGIFRFSIHRISSWLSAHILELL